MELRKGIFWRLLLTFSLLAMIHYLSDSDWGFYAGYCVGTCAGIYIARHVYVPKNPGKKETP